MLEAIVDKRNMERAYHQVTANKGAAGIDGMQTDKLRDFLQANWHMLRKAIEEGHYQPAPVKRVMIPKASGGVRGLGIPTVTDRLIQQAIAQWMGQLWEAEFSAYSYGFRPNRNAHQAVLQAASFLNEGKTYVIELDLEKFFDKVNHDKLMSLVSEKVADKRILRLIGAYLRSGIMENGLVSIAREGTPQGSPLSPLLSNIMLHELDKELTSRGLSFVRYADDCSIYVKSARAAKRVMEHITIFIETTLLLKVNIAKSQISRPTASSLLGFSFYNRKGSWRPRIAPKSVKRMRDKLRTMLKRSSSAYPEQHYGKLALMIRGWVAYFKLADCKRHLIEMDSWMRMRIRLIYWHKWKRPKIRMRKLLQLKVPWEQAYRWATSSKKSCRIAHSPITQITLSTAWLSKSGLPSFYRCYQSKDQQRSMF
jgi:RNA-directed DNA polymerase